MRFRHTLILLLVCAAVIMYFYLVEKPSRKASEKAGEKEKQVFTFDGDNVEKLIIERENGEKLVFRRELKPEENWVIEKPINADADNYTLNGIVSRFERLKWDKIVAEKPENPEVFGLKKPRFTVRFIVKGQEKPSVIHIGKRAPVGFKVYAQKEGDNRVMVVTAAVETNLKKKIEDYRNRKILDFLVSEVEDLEIEKRGGETIRLARTDEGWYLMDKKSRETVRADKPVITRVLTALRDLRVKDFVDDNPQDVKKYGLSTPAFRVKVRLENNKKQYVLLLGKRTRNKEKVYVKLEDKPNVVTVDASILAKIDKPRYAWRIKKIFDFYTWKAERLMIEDKYGVTYAVKNKKDNKWYDEKGKREKNRDAVNEILRMLRDITVVDYIDVNPRSLSPYGLDKPQIHVRVKVEGELEERGLLLGEVTAHGVYGMLEGEQEVYLLKKDFLDKFEKERLKILDAEEVSSPSTGGKGTPPSKSGKGKKEGQPREKGSARGE